MSRCLRRQNFFCKLFKCIITECVGMSEKGSTVWWGKYWRTIHRDMNPPAQPVYTAPPQGCIFVFSKIPHQLHGSLSIKWREGEQRPGYDYQQCFIPELMSCIPSEIFLPLAFLNSLSPCFVTYFKIPFEVSSVSCLAKSLHLKCICVFKQDFMKASPFPPPTGVRV